MRSTGHRLKICDQKIIEGIVTTVSEDGSVNIAPMGSRADLDFDTLLFRPYKTSATYRNLTRTRQGVFHITDDVELFARAAVGRMETVPKLIPAREVGGHILADACRWFAFRVVDVRDEDEPAQIRAAVVDRGTLRDFVGFNRAKHAVVEAAILATRLTQLPAARIDAELDRLAGPVAKTGGAQERGAFAFLNDYVRSVRDMRERPEV